MKLELVSHPLCPYVHRSAILLHEKRVPFELRYVDLANKPDWLLAISPRGKVPVLLVDGAPVFESAVINELVDELFPPRLMPALPLDRARTRMWVEIASDLVAAQYRMLNGPTEHDWAESLAKAEDIYDRLERELRGTFFSGDSLGLVDVAFAPALYRFVLVEHAFARAGAQMFAGHPRVDAWARGLADRASVKDSVPQDFEARFLASIHDRHGWFERLVA